MPLEAVEILEERRDGSGADQSKQKTTPTLDDIGETVCAGADMILREHERERGDRERRATGSMISDTITTIMT
jgi:hypothetical protein